MHIEVESIPPDRLAEESLEESSEAVRQRVQRAREIQRTRYAGERIACNARLDASSMNRHCALSAPARALLKQASERMGLSSRAYTRVLKVARTIADLAASESIELNHVAEAVQYRSLDRKYWG